MRFGPYKNQDFLKDSRNQLWAWNEEFVGWKTDDMVRYAEQLLGREFQQKLAEEFEGADKQIPYATWDQVGGICSFNHPLGFYTVYTWGTITLYDDGSWDFNGWRNCVEWWNFNVRWEEGLSARNLYTVSAGTPLNVASFFSKGVNIFNKRNVDSLLEFSRTGKIEDITPAKPFAVSFASPIPIQASVKVNV